MINLAICFWLSFLYFPPPPTLALSFYAISNLILPYPEIMVSLSNISIWQNQHGAKGIALHCFLKDNIRFNYEQVDSRRIVQQYSPKYFVFLINDYCLASEIMVGCCWVESACVCSSWWWSFNPNRSVLWSVQMFISIHFASLLFGKYFLLQ